MRSRRLLAAVSLPGSASSAAAESGGLTVQGTASVVSVPDRAELSFGVEAKGRPRAALSANAAEMRRVIAALRAAGGTDLKTQSVSLSPRYDERNEVQAFVATNTVSATITEIAKAGALIDAAVDAGANQVYGPSLSRSDQKELYRVRSRRRWPTPGPARRCSQQRPTSRSAASPRSSRAGRAARPVRRREGDGRRLDAGRARHAAGDGGRHGHVLGLVALANGHVPGTDPGTWPERPFALVRLLL